MKNKALEILRKIADGFLAGVLISLGGTVFLACNDSAIPYGKYIGAFFFSMALLCICIKGFSLYTGKIGYLPDKHSKEDISVLLLGLFGNALGTIFLGYLVAVTFPTLKETAFNLCSGKLEQGYHFALVRAILCGLLVYLAVDIYRKDNKIVGILLCIPTFILSGYEHSIADMFYFAASGIASLKAFGYLWIIILGNSLGALALHLLIKFAKKPPQNINQEEK